MPASWFDIVMLASLKHLNFIADPDFITICRHRSHLHAQARARSCSLVNKSIRSQSAQWLIVVFDARLRVNVGQHTACGAAGDLELCGSYANELPRIFSEGGRASNLMFCQ